MRIHPCVEIFTLGEAFGMARGQATAYAGQPGVLEPVSEDQRAKLRQVLDKLAGPGAPFRDCFPYTADSLDRLTEEVIENPEAHQWRLGELLRDACSRLRDELKRDLYLQVSPSMVPFVMRPEVGWEKAAVAFPDATPDMGEAAQCYGLERNTASVFHSMRVLEHGLRALANRLNVTIEGQTWGRIIRDMEIEIGVLRARPKQTPEQQAEVSAFSEIATEFRYFKDAWRDHVSHATEMYDPGQAQSIYVHVRDFMHKLATIPALKSSHGLS